MQVIETEFLVIGGGVAGLQAAITLSGHGRTLVVNKGGGCSPLAQGGVAVALQEADRGRDHVEDTLRAGKGECDPHVVQAMVREGPRRIADLIQWGARFDRDEAGRFLLGREAAHRRRRILKAGGDATGKEIVRTLQEEARSRLNVGWLDEHFASELLQVNGRCGGALLLPAGGNGPEAAKVVVARAVLLASGGSGQVYRRTSNPVTATGDGIAMARRCGARLRHMEFVQFHPTVLAEPYPPFLLSEAMRGEGGVLVNGRGEAFMARYHPDGDLAPRDDVSRAIWQEMTREGSRHVYLDMTAWSRADLERAFPTITHTCSSYGIDVAEQPVPVSPAAHFLMGGVLVDPWGRSDVPGLYAMGEVACSGVHGANRLASNSLLEALVFGARAAEAAAREASGRPMDPAATLMAVDHMVHRRRAGGSVPEVVRTGLQELMWSKVGLVRDGAGLATALGWINTQLEGFSYDPFDIRGMECLNLLYVAESITRSAVDRRRGVGAHYRSDGGQITGVAASAG